MASSQRLLVPSPTGCGTRGPVALLCDGEALVHGLSDWQSTGIDTAVAVALTAAPTGLLVAHTAEGCAGLVLSLAAGASQRIACAQSLDATLPTAMDVSEGCAVLWNGDEIVSLDLTLPAQP